MFTDIHQKVTATTLSSSIYATYGFDSFGYPTYSNAGPYAMTSVTAPNGLIPNVNQFVGYTSFEKVDTIFETPYKARFLYNSENLRARMLVSRNDTSILTRWYAGSHYMKEISGTTTKEYTYLGGDANDTELMAGRGFTGHENLPWFNLTNMNGRLYDPVVGRFLSPDPYVQSPDFTQNFNRYSYCLNNPLKYTDPKGDLFVLEDWIVGGFK